MLVSPFSFGGIWFLFYFFFSMAVYHFLEWIQEEKLLRRIGNWQASFQSQKCDHPHIIYLDQVKVSCSNQTQQKSSKKFMTWIYRTKKISSLLEKKEARKINVYLVLLYSPVVVVARKMMALDLWPKNKEIKNTENRPSNNIIPIRIRCNLGLV
jgi:hypothetical protein